MVTRFQLINRDPVSHHVTEEEKKRLKNLKKKLRRKQKLEGNIEENSDNHSAVVFKQAADNQIEINTTLETDQKGPHKTKKRKKNTVHSSQVADEKTAQASIVQAVDQPKKKKKKKLTVSATPEDNHTVSLHLSGYKNIDETEEPELNSTENVEKKNTSMKTKNIIHSSEDSETHKQKKKKRKAQRQCTSEMTQVTKKKNLSTPENSIFKGISDSRLAAYGENPKKFKNKVKYGKQNF